MIRNSQPGRPLSVFQSVQRKHVDQPQAAPVRTRSQESGFAFLLALIAILVMVALTATILQIGATQHRRAREEEAIWRGNQYARAIRLYYHKTGRYPQNIDDLTKGLPDLHFLRQEYKNPMNPSDGAWRFIYVNQAGQIIGSTKYATLQQMALLDLNGGVMPGTQPIPGQPGVPVSSMASTFGSSDSSQGQNPAAGAGSGNANGTSNGAGGTPQQGGAPNSPGGQQPPQDPNQPGATPPAAGGQAPSSGLGPGGLLSIGGQNQNPGSTSVQQTSVFGQANALTALKPTGPVDGPVLGAFLTGVACTGDAKSLKVYHGGKKYVEWEFIWNPLEDQAAAAAQQGGGGQGGILGGVPAGAAGNGSSFGSAPGSFGNSGQQPTLPQLPPQTPQQ